MGHPVNTPHIAIADLEEGHLLVGGLALPGLCSPAAVPGSAAQRAFAEATIGFVRRAGQELGCHLILRNTARPNGFTPALLVVRKTSRREDEALVQALVQEAAGLLAAWRALVLDGAGLDRVLDVAPHWGAVRLTKPEPRRRIGPKDVPILSAVNTDVAAWSALVTRTDFVLDCGVFPLAPPELENEVRAAEATSRVLAQYSTDLRAGLLANAAEAARAVSQRLGVGTALTLLCRDAEALANDLRAFRHPLLGEIPGVLDKVVGPGEEEAEQLAWQVLDYSDEAGTLAALEPDVRRALELAGSLAFTCGAWHDLAAGRHQGDDPVDLVRPGQIPRASMVTPAAPDIFISYPRIRLEWVRDHIYEPLKAWCGEERIYFDMRSLTGGMSWLPELARGVANSRVFLPIFCEEYFRSKFCKWELRLALKRDPSGEEGHILPILLHPMTLPEECSLINYEDATREGYWERVLEVLKARLS